MSPLAPYRKKIKRDDESTERNPEPILDMKRATLVLTFLLLPLLASCIEPQQATEDPLAPYKQSLLPTFQGDIASLGEIPRYRIAVRLDADALTLTGRQQVLYANLRLDG